jgi:hypothetical protein
MFAPEDSLGRNEGTLFPGISSSLQDEGCEKFLGFTNCES